MLLYYCTLFCIDELSSGTRIVKDCKAKYNVIKNKSLGVRNLNDLNRKVYKGGSKQEDLHRRV
jgi:hypothetical protein